MSAFKMDWNGAKVLAATRKITDRVAKEVATDVMEDAKSILKRKAKTTTDRGLLSQFSVEKSKYKTGGYTAHCQGPGNWHPPYHASFVEMGTFKDEPKPFMRPATKKNKHKANRKLRKALDKL